MSATTRPAAPVEEPEHRGERRRFLIWALMLNLIPSERVVERIVAEVEAEEVAL